VDINTLAKSVVDQAIGEKPKPSLRKDEEMARRGRLGGLKGGKARAERQSAKELTEIGKKGATARWRKDSRGDSDMR
jgi:hypothetical protein